MNPFYETFRDLSKGFCQVELSFCMLAKQMNLSHSQAAVQVYVRTQAATDPFTSKPVHYTCLWQLTDLLCQIETAGL